MMKEINTTCNDNTMTMHHEPIDLEGIVQEQGTYIVVA